jgi:hypothetical protein
MKEIRFLVIFMVFSGQVWAQFAPPAGEEGTTAIKKDSVIIVNWASEVIDFDRGLLDIATPDGGDASYGDSLAALGIAEGTSVDCVSLGDQGSITLTFPYSLRDGEGPDFAVFENSFSDDYLEFAFVEVSTDGERFVRFPAISNTQTETQIETYGTTDTKLIHNLAGKYRQGYGTPFDLADLVDSTGIDLNEILYVRLVDVIGTIDPLYGTKDSEGNLINDPYKTDFESGGFDLDAVGVINDNNPILSAETLPELTGQVYPNPTSGWLNLPEVLSGQMITLTDLEGRIVANFEGLNQINLSTYNLAAGTYLIRYQLDGLDSKQFRIVYLP